MTIRLFSVERKRTVRDTESIEDIYDEETSLENALHASRSAREEVSTFMVENVERQKELEVKGLELEERSFKSHIGCSK